MSQSAQVQAIKIQATLRTDWHGLLVGLYDARMEKDGRVAIPTAWRETLTKAGFSVLGLYVRPTGKCLVVLPVEWHAREAPDAQPYLLSLIDPNTIAVVRMAPIDRSGRIALPPPFLEEIGLTGAVALVGMGNQFQVWSPQALDGSMSGRPALRLTDRRGVVALCDPHLTIETN